MEKETKYFSVLKVMQVSYEIEVEAATEEDAIEKVRNNEYLDCDVIESSDGDIIEIEATEI